MRKVLVNGKVLQFYTVGELATAIGRCSGTLRKWEIVATANSMGYPVLPKALYRHSSKNERLYSPRQVGKMVALAEQFHTDKIEGSQKLPKNFILGIWKIWKEEREAIKNEVFGDQVSVEVKGGEESS